MSESVNHPAHYNAGKFEVIDVIQDAFSKNEFYGFCMGNCLKYLLRARHKHDSPVEDLEKCRWYLERLICFLKERESES